MAKLNVKAMAVAQVDVVDDGSNDDAGKFSKI